MSRSTTSIDGVSRQIVTPSEWKKAQDAVTEREKAHMREGDQIAAERRRMPWLKMDAGFTFEGTDGKRSLVQLFNGRKQLIVYHFMFGPEVGGWPDAGCVGCSMLADQVSHLDHLHARDVEFVFVSTSPLENLQRYRARMGWDVAWYSGSQEFNRACGVSKDAGHDFGLNVFYRDGESVYRTYFAGHRGGERFGTVWSFVDVTPLGRQEKWEDSPAGSPQGEAYQWWRRHGEYEASACKDCGCERK